MEQLVNFEIRNRLRRWTLDPTEAEEYRGTVRSTDSSGLSIEKLIIIPALYMRRSEDGKLLYNYNAQYELVSFSKAYQAFVNSKRNNATVLCEWSISQESDEYSIQGRNYENFDIVLPMKLSHADGAFLVTVNGEKLLLDPNLPYFANNIAFEALPKKLRPVF